MPAICVDCNGKRLATVNTDGFDVLALHVRGAQDQEPAAALDFSGASYGGDEQVSLTWIPALPLALGDVVTVSLTDPVSASDKGKTYEELFPDAGPKEDFKIPPLDQAFFEEIAKRQRFHGGFMFRLDTSSGTHYSGSTRAPEESFNFHVLWDFTRSGRARVGLSTNSLDDIRKREPGRNHVREELTTGGSVSFRVIASSVIPASPE
ncbi:hypothetical protein [Massilia cavernae]|uniref:Uncharacterized protein n=1 Tax=Massilia cavernae TaxID=2320864 RepID=A0A418XGF9_9BURK|nr:hypothetical protein [Massilia cavernae]RJG11537.1 hypothetical protein D3872_19285 [Massilia cavernae]